MSNTRIIAVGNAQGPWLCDITDENPLLTSTEAWHEVNSRGDGDLCGHEDDDVNELADYLGGELIHTSGGDHEVAVYEVAA